MARPLPLPRLIGKVTTALPFFSGFPYLAFLFSTRCGALSAWGTCLYTHLRLGLRTFFWTKCFKWIAGIWYWPKIYRKSVLHQLKYRFGGYLTLVMMGGGPYVPPLSVFIFLPKISPPDQTLRPTCKFLILGILYHDFFFRLKI